VTVAPADPVALLDGVLDPLPPADRATVVSDLGPLAIDVAERVDELVSMLAA
jgi:hypothetical protein